MNLPFIIALRRKMSMLQIKTAFLGGFYGFFLRFRLFNSNFELFAGLEAFGADLDAGTVGKLGPLEVRLFAVHSGRVVLGGADTVGKTADHNTSFIADWARFHDNLLVSLTGLW